MQKKYEQIVSWVHAKIESGAIRQGDRLPSENVLAKQFQMSRQTIRRAMEALTMDGIVESRRGSGTYVSVNTRRYTGKEIRIAVMLTFVDTYIFPALVKGIESVLSDAGERKGAAQGVYPNQIRGWTDRGNRKERSAESESGSVPESGENGDTGSVCEQFLSRA